MFKKLLVIFMLLASLLFAEISNEDEIQNLISEYYGYETLVMFKIIKGENVIFIQTLDNDYSDNEHITFVLTTVRALYKYIEISNFDINRFSKIEFKSGSVLSYILQEDFLYALKLANSRTQESFLNDARK